MTNSDLVQRLRTHGNMGDKWSMLLSNEAANEIESLRQQLADSQKQVTLLREWAVEAVEFVGRAKWSPSLESQGRRVIAATEPK